jgi:glycosyltransferase involved in cell wall biosynthesis
MIGFREPGYFWLLSILHDVPLIWGPIGGYNFPAPYLFKFYGLKIIFQQALKNFLNFFSFLLPSVLFTFFRAQIILLAIPINNNSIIFKIRNAVIFSESFINSPPKLKSSRFRFGQRRNSLNLIIIGKLVPRKLVDIAIESLAQLPLKMLKKVNLHVVGDGPCRQVLEKLVTQKSLNHQVSFYGKLSHKDCMSLLNSSDFLIHTSVDEGLPSSVGEALMLKKKILAFNAAGISLIKKYKDIELMPYPKNREEAVLCLSNTIFKAIDSNSQAFQDKKFLITHKGFMEKWSARNRLLFFISLISIGKKIPK